MCRSETLVDTCSSCQKEAPCRFSGTDKAICTACQRARRLDVCGACGNTRECRFAGTAKAVCNQCANLREPCIRCGETRLIRQRSPDGRALCWSCVPPIIEPCTECHRERVVNGRVDGLPYCPSCYPRQPSSFRDCLRCGRHEHLLQSRLCLRCSADDKIRSLFPEEIIASHPRVSALRTACAAADPERILSTFRYRTTVDLLRWLLANPELLTHQAIDEIAAERATRTVRAFLVEYKVLPHRDEHLARFEAWITRTAVELLNPKERRAFTQFARWRHLRYLRGQPGLTRPAQAAFRKRELQHVINLLNWAHQQGSSLVSLRQEDVDRWLGTGLPDRRLVREFLKWTRRNAYSTTLTAPSVMRSQLTIGGTDGQDRMQLLDNALSSPPSDPRTTMAAALVLLYGITPARIVQLRVQDLFLDGGVIFIRLGSEPLALPKKIGEIAELALAARDAARMFGSVTDNEWLFPGTRAGHPLSPQALTRRLKMIGIEPQAVRSGALTSLAGQLPPVILARLTGLDITSATRWAGAVSASNARYAAFLLGRER
ncbi:site-specific integrase [Arthrobacter sp. A2-55]|uniref:site-specific integrase n=1 Tax=Arthrobacter sp. A2-55 TaxID=2897337 RepID=UPI0021CD2510|nr:site-specific integrase [Arthrobacter sp. A2-55]